MLDSILQMGLNISSSIDIIDFIESPNKEWHNNYKVLTWQYGKHHLIQSYIDLLHCCMFALGGNYKHSHQ